MVEANNEHGQAASLDAVVKAHEAPASSAAPDDPVAARLTRYEVPGASGPAAVNSAVREPAV